MNFVKPSIRSPSKRSSEGSRAFGPLRRSDVQALHEQLSASLRTEHLAKAKPGDRFPTEEDICKTYRLSRVTVRRAIQTLVDDGLLVRRQGKGTFAAQPRPRIIYEIDRLGPFMDAFATTGEKVVARLVDFRWASADAAPEIFAKEPNVLLYDRVYETAGKPHGALQIALPARIGEQVSRADASSKGVYQILKELGIEPVRASFSISSELPDKPLAATLGLSMTTPLLSLERISFDRKGKAIECTTHHLLPEVYKLSVSVAARKR